MRRSLIACLAPLLAVLLASCAPPSGRSAAHLPVTRAGTIAYPAAAPVREVAAGFRVRDIELPIQCSVSDHDSTRALLSVRTGKAVPSAQLALLDLTTGRSSTLVSSAVTTAEPVDILGAKMGSGYVAWEEVTAGETELPLESVHWRLYASAIGADGRIAGEPELVDDGTASRRSRPIFAFRRDELIWMTDDVETFDRTWPAARKGKVRIIDLPRHRKPRQLAKLDAVIRNLSVSEGKVVVSYLAGLEESSMGIAVLDPDDGRFLLRFAPPNLAGLQHPAAFHEGALAFTVGYGSPAAPAGVYVRDAKGALTNVGGTSDPCFAGDYVFFERDGGTAMGTGERWIVARRLDRPEESVVASCVPDEEGAWQTSQVGYREDTAVLYRDRSGSPKDVAGRPTVIRVVTILRRT